MIRTKASAVIGPTPGWIISSCTSGRRSASCSIALLNSSIIGLSRSSNSKRSEEHTSELQSRLHLVCRLLLEKKKNNNITTNYVANHALGKSSITGHHLDHVVS